MSKGLEALSYLDGIIANSNMTINVLKTLEAIKTIKQDLERLEKLEKVVEILSFVEIFDIEHDEIRYYVDGGFEPGEITKEEYDLLKEMFGDEN